MMLAKVFPMHARVIEQKSCFKKIARTAAYFSRAFYLERQNYLSMRAAESLER